jgi:tRNA A58 N-methylase Trm61
MMIEGSRVLPDPEVAGHANLPDQPGKKVVEAGTGSGQSFSSLTSSVLDCLLEAGCGQ